MKDLLGTFVEDLKGAYGTNLKSVILYGSKASGEDTKKYSDYNVLIILEHIGLSELSIDGIMSRWIKRGNPPPMMFTKAMFARSSDVFPVEFLDMRDNHQILYGENPFAGMNVNEVLKNFFTSGEGSNNILTGTFGVFSGVVSLLTVLVVSFYLVAEEKGMKKFISALVPAGHQGFVMNLVEQIQKKMGLWVLGQVFLSVVIFLFTFAGLKILGVKYALLLGLLAGLLEIVPYLGPILSSVPSIFFAFIQSPPLAIAVIILYVLIQKTENYVLTPKIMEKTVGTSPLLVLVALLVGFKLAGIVGVLIAVPLAGAITVVISEVSQNKQAQDKPLEEAVEKVV
jgi:predicted PurR-regulated permease PerM